MRKSIKVGETLVQMSSDQLSQRLLAAAVRDEAPLLEIFSHELSGVALSLFHDNGETRKNNKAELMNEISTILTDVLTESACHVIEGCTGEISVIIMLIQLFLVNFSDVTVLK